MKIVRLLAFFGLYLAGHPLAMAQNPSDCPGAITICGNQKINFNPAGTGDLLDLGINGNQPGCLSEGGENAAVWYRIVIDRPGTLTFAISPAAPSDFDWAMWGPFKTEDTPCRRLGSPVRCNAAAPTTATGLSLTATSSVGQPGSSNPWSKYLEVQMGEVYYLLVDNWSAGQDRNGRGISFELTWGGTARLAAFYGDFAHRQQCLQFDFRNTVVACQDNLTFSWDFGDGSPAVVAPAPSHTYARGGTYSVVLNVSAPSGERYGTSKTLTVDPLRTSGLEIAFAHQKRCAEVSFQPQVKGSCSNKWRYNWDFGDRSPANTEPAPTHFYARGGSYTVVLTVTDEAGLSKTFTESVSVEQAPPLGIRGDLLFCQAKGRGLLEATPGFVAYQWSRAQPTDWSAPSTSPIWEINQPGQYWVRATNAQGCPILAQVAVADCCPPEVVLPNAFTPHRSEGANDGYRARADYVQTFQLHILDRWGVLVFQTNDPGQAWDGTVRGQRAAAGAYRVVVEYGGCTGKKRLSQTLYLVD